MCTQQTLIYLYLEIFYRKQVAMLFLCHDVQKRRVMLYTHCRTYILHNIEQHIILREYSLKLLSIFL